MKRMRDVRRSSGLTLEQCASSAGVTVQRWCRWERAGWISDRDMACKVADILGVTLDQLAGRTPVDDPPLAV